MPREREGWDAAPAKGRRIVGNTRKRKREGSVLPPSLPHRSTGNLTLDLAAKSKRRDVPAVEPAGCGTV